jgi:hypothetical protein
MYKITGLDGREHKFLFQKNYHRKDRGGKSQWHTKARDLLVEKFPNYPLYEEVTLPGSSTPRRKSSLYLDFYVPQLELAVEVHGRQHYEYVAHFHKTRADFRKSLQRDRDKEEWCQINEISLIVLPWNQTQQWEQILDQRG